MIDADPDTIAVFLEEATELFSDFEQCLLLLETLPDDREVINKAFRAAHTIKGGAGMIGFEHLAAFTHEVETLLDELRDKQLLCTQNIIDAMLASADVIKAHLALIKDGRSEKVPNQDQVLNRIWQVRADGDAPASEEPKSTVVLAPGLVAPPAVVAAPPPPEPVAEKAGGAPAAETGSASIRVSIEKVDQLVNLVGELSIAQAMVGQLVQEYSPHRLLALQESVAQLERHCRDLQTRVLSIRMVPVKGVFDRFNRIVRDVAAQAGKQVGLVIHGEDTELDKTVVEKIADPLTHLVRNAIDHGLEPSEARAAAGKPPKGTLSLSAYQKGANIFIEVKDDGRGLDRARILAKGVERGLVPPGRELTDDEVYELIFQPGFSTAEKVTNLSGRGVGMDVVRRNIDELQGKVTIQTEAGKGTTFRIQLPLTLAMMDGLLVRAGKQVFLVPLISVITSFRPTLKQLGRVDATEVVEVRGGYVPLVRLNAALLLPGLPIEPTKGLVVVIDDGTRTWGLLVDELLGQLQVVVKSLEDNYGRVKGLGGATILGDGEVALILDPPALLELSRERSFFKAAPGPLPLPALETV